MEKLRGLLIGLMNLSLVLVIIGGTLFGFIAGGSANPFQGFSFGMALVGAVVGFLVGGLSSGLLALLLDIRELLKKAVANGGL
ncbi:MAG TPA: hypothetical protein VD978_00635 [Azospirillum sp.]|nr:hypothetical protein [Azospirillum sp.]